MSNTLKDAQEALALWDDPTGGDILDEEGYPIRGSLARAEWLIEKLRPLITEINPTPGELEDARLAEEDVPLVVAGKLTAAGRLYVSDQRTATLFEQSHTIMGSDGIDHLEGR